QQKVMIERSDTGLTLHAKLREAATSPTVTPRQPKSKQNPPHSLGRNKPRHSKNAYVSGSATTQIRFAPGPSNVPNPSQQLNAHSFLILTAQIHRKSPY
ncbi:MAG: hypothetical protein RR729_12005, partial [Comamonas sp.]